MAAFEGAREELSRQGIEVVAASTDSRDNTGELCEELGVGFPVGYGLPLVATASAVGAYFEMRRGIMHGTGFLVRPDGAIHVALYSSGAIGRLVPGDVLALARTVNAQSD